MTIPLDKQAHALGGYAIVMTSSVFGNAAGYGIWGLIIGMALCVIAAALKEWWYDAANPLTHSVDVWDFVATVLGGGGAAIVVCVAKIAASLF